MKKEKPHSQLKAAKKKIKDDVHKKLAKALQNIANELSKNGSKLDIDIEKESKKLAKKFVKNLTLNLKPAEEIKTAATSEAPVKEASAPVVKTTPKPVITKSAPKNGTAKATPTKQVKK
jgi:hypothetical protein